MALRGEAEADNLMECVGFDWIQQHVCRWLIQQSVRLCRW